MSDDRNKLPAVYETAEQVAADMARLDGTGNRRDLVRAMLGTHQNLGLVAKGIGEYLNATYPADTCPKGSTRVRLYNSLKADMAFIAREECDPPRVLKFKTASKTGERSVSIGETTREDMEIHAARLKEDKDRRDARELEDKERAHAQARARIDALSLEEKAQRVLTHVADTYGKDIVLDVMATAVYLLELPAIQQANRVMGETRARKSKAA